jgi:3-dehydroquinate synthetase
MHRQFDFTRSTTTKIALDVAAEAKLSRHVEELNPDGVVIVHDASLTDIANRVATTLGAREVLEVADTEDAKQLDVVRTITERLHRAGATRATVMVAIGGGTITDLAGFVASIYLRGMPVVFCPTTTLAMCDAALGGKNGVDHCGLKNRLGTIRQPEAIIMDINWLDSLPDEMFREGIVEVIKKAALLNKDCFSRLEALAPLLLTRDPKATQETVAMAIDMKMAVVLADEQEGDFRRALNAGHTIGHAMEALAAGSLRHGHAVALGMIAECRAAGVDEAITQRIAKLLHAIGVSTELPRHIADPIRLWDLARQDKKAIRGTVPMYVPKQLGEGIVVELTAASIAKALA